MPVALFVAAYIYMTYFWRIPWGVVLADQIRSLELTVCEKTETNVAVSQREVLGDKPRREGDVLRARYGCAQPVPLLNPFGPSIDEKKRVKYARAIQGYQRAIDHE